MLGEDAARALRDGTAEAADLEVEPAESPLPGQVTEMTDIAAVDPARATAAEGASGCPGTGTNGNEDVVRVDGHPVGDETDREERQQRVGHGNQRQQGRRTAPSCAHPMHLTPPQLHRECGRTGLPCRLTLALHPDGVLALLDQGGVVHDQHGIGSADQLVSLFGQHTFQPLVRPIGCRHEVVQLLHLAWYHARRHGLHALALARQ